MVYRLKSLPIEPEYRLYAEPAQDRNRPQHFAVVHLGTAGAAILEKNRRFADASAGAAQAVEHFLLERIAVREKMIEVGAGQERDAVAAIAAAGVAGREAEKQARKCVDAPAHELARDGPVGRAAAGNIA